MDGVKTLRVRVLGLGPGAEPALRQAINDVRSSWATGGGVAVEGEVGGDDARGASRTIRRWCDVDRLDVVLTVGRAGPGGGDFVPEATAALLERALPGIEERMHLSSPRDPEALLFRGRAGMRRGTLVVNLPGRPARSRLIIRLLAPVVRHVVEKARGSERECTPPGAAP